MKIVIMGSPGAGKGTQAKIICKYFNIAHISTGDLLREEINLKTELGLKISSIINSGELVSDDIVSELLQNRIRKSDCNNGFILDGYPRNVSQAKKVEFIVGNIDKVIFIYVPDEVILERMNGRRICKGCGQMFHLKYNPPKTNNVCDLCGEEIFQREDDNIEVVKNRLNVYHKLTTPLIEYYKNKNLIEEIDGTDKVDRVSEKIINYLKSLNKI